MSESICAEAPQSTRISKDVWRLFAELGDLMTYRNNLGDYSSEDKEIFDLSCNLFVEAFFEKLNSLQEWANYTKKWSIERLGKSSTEEYIPPEIVKWLIVARKTNLFEDIHLPTKTRIKFCESFRPK